MEFETLLYKVENRVASITFNTPDKLNAFGDPEQKELISAIGMAQEDTDVKVVVLTGAGRAFCAGGDINGFGKGTLEDRVAKMHRVRGLQTAFYNLTKPFISAVNGYAIGGGLSLCTLSDIVIASEKAKFGAAFMKLGLVPDVGLMYSLPRIVGLQKAKELVYTAENIDAAEAYRLGLVNKVVEHDKLDEVVAKLCDKLVNMPSFSMATAKRVMDMSLDMGLNELFEMEAYAQAACCVSEDSKEAIDAFRNKRKPNFK